MNSIVSAMRVPKTDFTRTAATGASCRSCGAGGLERFYVLRGIPVFDCLLMATRQEALAVPRGDLELCFCPSCGFIGNAAFEAGATEYSQRYEETQGFSATFRSFATGLAGRLIDDYGLAGKTVLEIGCGKGEFLAELCALAGARGIGVDPSFVPGRLPPEFEQRLEVHRQLYGVEHTAIAADFVCCRHTLEHIPDVRAFVGLAVAAARRRPGTAVWFEVPDVMRVLQEGAFWDIYYEHCSYFTLGSLARLFRSAGLELVELATEYDDQYLVVGGVADGTAAAPRRGVVAVEDPAAVGAAVAAFGERCAGVLEGWRRRIAAEVAGGGRVAIWGAGSKGVAFLSTLAVGEAVAYAVDINPHKQGRFLPGTGHEVIGPDRLAASPPTHVIAMNPIYQVEIREELERRGIAAEVLPVTNPALTAAE